MGNLRLTCYDKFAHMQRISQGLRHFSRDMSITLGFTRPFQRDGEVTSFRYPAKTTVVLRSTRGESSPWMGLVPKQAVYASCRTTGAYLKNGGRLEIAQ